MNGSLSDGRQKALLNWESKPHVPPCLMTNVFLAHFALFSNDIISLHGNSAELAVTILADATSLTLSNPVYSASDNCSQTHDR